jgi:hypothetical protein
MLLVQLPMVVLFFVTVPQRATPATAFWRYWSGIEGARTVA